jgi:hypothetical protein
LTDGTTEKRLVLRVLWDREEWMADIMTSAQAQAVMSREVAQRSVALHTH